MNNKRFFMSGIIVIQFTLCTIQNIIYCQPENEKKFQIGMGLGYGLANNICPPCNQEKQLAGISFSAEAGWKVNRTFTLSVSPLYWTDKGIFSRSSPKTAQHSRSFLLFNTYYYPLINKQLFFKWGVGAGNYYLTPQLPILTRSGNFTLSSFNKVGLSYSIGAGYTIKLSSKLWLRPQLYVMNTFIKSLQATTGETVPTSNNSKLFGFSTDIFFSP